VRQQLKDERIATFTFHPRMIKEVEALHISQAGSGFQPLYGGSDGSLPWAVMGAEDSRREYIWGTAMTNEPRHSELPALRDLLLRQGGWQQLKREASLKADEEGARRAKMNHQRQSWSPSKALALPRSVVLQRGSPSSSPSPSPSPHEAPTRWRGVRAHAGPPSSSSAT